MNKQLWFLPLLLSMFFNRLSAQIQVTDLVSKDSDKNSMPRNFVQFNNLLFFEAITESYGKEIWVSDGTVDNTRLLKDIYPGKSSGITTVFSQSSVTFNDKLFFVANDGQNGKQIWSTDGTEEGTVPVTDLPKLNMSNLTLLGDYFYFLSKEGFLLHVWKSDGTSEGTIVVKGDLPIRNYPSFEGAANGLFFFTFQPGETNKSRVWRSDGTESGTFPVTQEVDGNGAGPTGTSSLTQYIEFNDDLYFVVKSSSIFPFPTTVGIMKADGIPENTVPVKAVHEGNWELVDFADVIEINNKLYFSFFLTDYRHLFIWESDGTENGTKKIYDVSGPKYYVPSNLATNGTDLIFTGKSNNDETALLKLNPENYQVEEIKELITNVNQPFFTRHFNINLISKITDNSFYIAPPTSGATATSAGARLSMR